METDIQSPQTTQGEIPRRWKRYRSHMKKLDVAKFSDCVSVKVEEEFIKVLIRNIPFFGSWREATFSIWDKEFTDINLWFERHHRELIKILEYLRNYWTVRGLHLDHKKNCPRLITQRVFVESLIRYPKDQVDSFLSWMVVHNVKILDVWDDLEETNSPIRSSRNMNMLKIDMSCDETRKRVRWGAILYGVDGSVNYRAGELKYQGPALSPDMRDNVKIKEHPLFDNWSVGYELQALLNGVRIATYQFGWQNLLVLTDCYMLAQLLMGFFLIPSFIGEECLLTIQILRGLKNYAIIHEAREANLVADALSKGGSTLMMAEYSELVDRGVDRLNKMEIEFGSFPRLQPPSHQRHLQSSGTQATLLQLPSRSTTQAQVSLPLHNLQQRKFCTAIAFPKAATINVDASSKVVYSSFFDCMLPRSTHETFARKLYQALKNHKCFSKSKLSRSDYDLQRYKLGNPGSLHYLNQSNCYKLEGVDDSKETTKLAVTYVCRLVDKINSSIGQDLNSKLLIGVLDIYGFESFKTNSMLPRSTHGTFGRNPYKSLKNHKVLQQAQIVAYGLSIPGRQLIISGSKDAAFEENIPIRTNVSEIFSTKVDKWVCFSCEECVEGD